MKKFLMLHGINHNMFGTRDPVQYGTAALVDIDRKLQALGEELGVSDRQVFQSMEFPWLGSPSGLFYN